MFLEASIRPPVRGEPTRTLWDSLKLISAETARAASTAHKKVSNSSTDYSCIISQICSLSRCVNIMSGATAAVDICWGGYYCPPGQEVPNPSEYICPRGMHCPNGSEIYQECAPGTYTNYTGAVSCDVCPEGFYCLTVQPHTADDNLVACPAGYYCPEGNTLCYTYTSSYTCVHVHVHVCRDILEI